MQTASEITELPEPSSKHATCAWCAAEYCSVIELIDHVDDHHLTDKRDIEALDTWKPTPEEVAAVVNEMRPIIDRLAARDQQLLAEWTNAA